MKMIHIGGNEYVVSGKVAMKLCNHQPPAWGRERKVEHNGETYWLHRANRDGKNVWILHLQPKPYTGPFPMKVKI